MAYEWFIYSGQLCGVWPGETIEQALRFALMENPEALLGDAIQFAKIMPGEHKYGLVPDMLLSAGFQAIRVPEAEMSFCGPSCLN